MLNFVSTSTRMLKTRERTISEDPKTSTFKVYRMFAKPSWNPPIADEVLLSFKVPSYTRLHEVIRSYHRNTDPFTGGYDLYRPNFLKKWKPVQHYKRWIDPQHEDGRVSVHWGCQSLTALGNYSSLAGADIPALLVADHSLFRSTFGAFGDHNLGVPSLIEGVTGDDVVPPPVGLSVLVEKSLQAMLPKVRQEMSLINSIIELKDFRSIPRLLSNMRSFASKANLAAQRLIIATKSESAHSLSLTSADVVAKPLRRMLRRIRASFPREHGPTLRELLQIGGELQLTKQFAIDPLFRDIKTLYESLVGIDKRLRRLINLSGRRQMKHFNFSWQEYESPTLYLKSTSSYLLNTGQFAQAVSPEGFTGCYEAHRLGWSATRRVTHYNPTIFHAQVEYNYRFTQYQLEHAQVLSLLDKIGLSAMTPEIIWNALPWSFLIDWVFGVNQWLAGRRELRMKPTINISRYLWSCERFRRYSTYVKTTQKTATITSTLDTYLPTMYETTYRRDVQLPVRNSSIFGSSLSDEELELGVPLAITLAARRKTRGR